ncbi:hypothetical protein FGO68_gene14278 [Halteria grandinella]|uniref:Uncharacterized protein n=1 Tax=Halteria grandinella TaxID=5974 RepID=A0A8J8NY00_HALGN|nr:hypothetical protein FGO68_gene14278 [Halteria grandinella]
MRGKFGLQNLNFSKVLDSTNTLNELNPESMLSPTVLKRNQIQFLGADSNFVTKFAQNTANSSGGPHRRIQSINLGNANLFATTTQTPTTQNNLGLKPHLVLDKQKNSLKIETTHQKPLRPLKLVQPNRAISETPKLLEYRAPNDMPQQFITNNIRTPVEYVTAETQQQFFYRRQSPAMQKMVMQQKIIHRLAQNQLRQENQSVLMTQSTPLQSQYE